MAEEANGMEKGYELICKLEQDEQDRLGHNPSEDDFRGEDSDSNIAMVAIKQMCAKGGVLSFISRFRGDSLKKETLGLNLLTGTKSQSASKQPEVGRFSSAWGTACMEAWTLEIT